MEMFSPLVTDVSCQEKALHYLCCAVAIPVSGELFVDCCLALTTSGHAPRFLHALSGGRGDSVLPIREPIPPSAVDTSQSRATWVYDGCPPVYAATGPTPLRVNKRTLRREGLFCGSEGLL